MNTDDVATSFSICVDPRSSVVPSLVQQILLPRFAERLALLPPLGEERREVSAFHEPRAGLVGAAHFVEHLRARIERDGLGRRLLAFLERLLARRLGGV